MKWIALAALFPWSALAVLAGYLFRKYRERIAYAAQAPTRWMFRRRLREALEAEEAAEKALPSAPVPHTRVRAMPLVVSEPQRVRNVLTRLRALYGEQADEERIRVAVERAVRR